MGVGRGAGGPWPSWILTISAKKVVFLASIGKKQISPLLALPRKSLEKSPGGLLEKILPTPMPVKQSVSLVHFVALKIISDRP